MLEDEIFSYISWFKVSHYQFKRGCTCTLLQPMAADWSDGML